MRKLSSSCMMSDVPLKSASNCSAVRYGLAPC
jgi:hypothetical protein